jgi:hypothetical protein
LAKPGTKLGDSVFMNIPRVENQMKKNNLFAKQKELSKDNLSQLQLLVFFTAKMQNECQSDELLVTFLT